MIKKLIKRLFCFQVSDWKHILCLLISMIKYLFRCDLKKAEESLFWIRIHLSYDSKKIK